MPEEQSKSIDLSASAPSADQEYTHALADALNGEAECCSAQGREDEAKALRQQLKEVLP